VRALATTILHRSLPNPELPSQAGILAGAVAAAAAAGPSAGRAANGLPTPNFGSNQP
jgi:hypothetical protein